MATTTTHGDPGTRAMTEDELLTGITDALTLAGWSWFHVRRSDLALVQGRQGWPDLFAVHGGRGLTLVLELKSETGRLDYEQAAWFAELRAAGLSPVVIRPSDYDAILALILGRRRPRGDEVPQPRRGGAS